MARTRTFRGGMLAAVALVVLAACSGGSGGDKAGGDAAPVTLRLGTMEGPGAPYADSVNEFARLVEDGSGGTVRIEIVWDAAVEFFGSFEPGADQKVAGLVKDGDLDMALIPARAWDELGVTSLQALQAPFLVSDEELLGQVARSDMAGSMLAGLDQAGVEGLALLPEGLRHPVGFQGPLVSLGDFSGATIRALPSNASYRLLEALGATPVDTDGDAFAADVAAGRIAGAESGFPWAPSLPVPGTVTANVTFFPKMNALVVNKDVVGGLSDEQASAVRQAAEQTLAYVLEQSPSEAERAAEYCRLGGQIAFATDAELAALEQAAAPVYASLEANEETRAFIEQIGEMKSALAGAGASITACEPSEEAPPTAGTGTPAFPEGVYRVELDPTFLLEQGMDTVGAQEEGTIHTLTIADGVWEWSKRNASTNCGGTYAVEDGRVAMTEAKCGGTYLAFSATWTLEDGELRFFDILSELGVDPYAEILWGSKGWTKID